MNPTTLTQELLKVYDEKLEAVILYGSAAGSEFQQGHSDFNIMIVLKELSPVELAKSSKIMKKWFKEKNPLPMIVSKEWIRTSLDVFPIEFWDIKDQHKVLHGRDFFSDLTFDNVNLRHQCEHELKSKLLALYSRIPLMSDKPKMLIKLILESSSSFFAIFRGVLRLTGIKPDASKKQMLEQILKATKVDPSIFIEIIDVRDKKLIWRNSEALEKFEQYLTSIESVVRYVDTFQKGEI